MADRRLSTGVDGLDAVLEGGLIPGRGYLVRGDPGTGKTILGCHFLLDGVDRGETALFVNLEESAADIKQNGEALGFDLDAVEFLDLSPNADVFVDDRSYTVFEASDVEQEPFAEKVTEAVEAVDPDRVFVDPITRIRHLTRDDRTFRKQAIGFIEYLTRDDATALFTSQHTDHSPDEDLQFLSDGTIELGDASSGQSISIPKFRGSGALSGTHAMEITDEGIVVYPALQPADHAQQFVAEPVSSGVPGLDELLYGGIERGTATVISGPTGAGKTTLGTHFMKEAAKRGERSVIYLFEENATTFRERSESIGVPVTEMCESGSLYVEEMEPLQLSPQQFAGRVRREVESKDADVVMIDGIDGYQVSIRGPEEELVRRLHALSRYLKNVGATVILIDETPTVTGEFAATGTELSYLADNIIFLQHIEHQGRLRKVGGVLKKRTSDFERSLREFEITGRGLEVGEPLTELREILSGAPAWEPPEHDE
ncbi:recombinase RecA [Halobellus sp. Atlit-31R]|nr:recombinase RecA [Halobellus sp. Atlit-31R]